MSWALGLLALLQSLLSLLSARRWLSFIHRYRLGAGSPLPTRETGPADAAQSGAPHSPISNQDDTPPLSLIVPCRGYETGLEENLAAYGQQDYPDYELILVTSGPEDLASATASAIPGARLIYGAPQSDEGEKVTQLRAAVRQARPSSRVLVFADSDGRPGPGWLRELVRPLARPEQQLGATTCYRWHLPARSALGRSLPSIFRAVWNSFIASVLGDHSRNFCWGGGTAVRRETFARLNVDQYWRGSVSDDYRLTAALREAGLPIRFVPTCLVPTHGDCGWRELFSWTTRQIIITRVYAPGLWQRGLASNGLYCGGVAALLWTVSSPPAMALLASIALAGLATGAARVAGACAAMPDHRHEIRRLRWAFILLAPLVPLLMLYNFTRAGLTRTIAWRGTSYRLLSPQQTAVLHRAPAADSAALRDAGPGPTTDKPMTDKQS